MATGRTVTKHARCYIDGHDMSGYSRSIDSLAWQYDEADFTCEMSDTVHVAMNNHPDIRMGALNTVLDSTATVGSHTVLKTSAEYRQVMVPFGIRAAPAVGDPVWMGAFGQNGYQATEEGGAIVANIPFGAWYTDQLIRYAAPWGILLHPYGLENAVNAAVGIDDNGGASTNGGYMMYQIFAQVGGAGTVTISVQDAAVNNDGGFALCQTLTSGAIAFGSIPCAGIVALANTGATAAVRQYLRWQVALAGGMTSATFALAFVRGLRIY